jgi:hypothetical protein
MNEFWYLLPYAAMAALLALYLAVRLLLDWLDYRRSRRMSPYVMRYGAANYWGTARPNVRTGERL